MAATNVRPVLEFREYGIAIHFVLRFKDGDPTDKRIDLERELKSESNFESLERDLLSSVNRELRLSKGGTRRLFGSRTLDSPEGWKCIELRYPASLPYAAEGKTNPMFPPGDQWMDNQLTTDRERHRRFRFLPSLTEFRSGVAVLHLVLAPISDQDKDESVVNEWDLIVLSKLWQGGEGVGPTDEHSLEQSVVFGLPGHTDLATRTINELAQDVLKHATPAYNVSRSYWESKDEDDPLAFEPRAGTFELTLDLGGENTDALLKRLAELDDSNSHASVASVAGPHSDVRSALVAVEGVLCGLLDYSDIEDDEIEDVFANPIMADDGTFLDIHNGTMMMLAKNIRRIKSPDPDHDVGVNPYLLLPQAVLLHNEYLLRRANLLANERVSIKASIHELQQVEPKIREALQQDRLPNIFHYRTERRWYDGGHQARGIDDLQRVVEQQLAYTNGLLDQLRATNERMNALMFGLLGTFIAAVAILGNWEPLEKLFRAPHVVMWLGLVGVVLLLPFVVFLWRRFGILLWRRFGK